MSVSELNKQLLDFVSFFALTIQEGYPVAEIQPRFLDPGVELAGQIPQGGRLLYTEDGRPFVDDGSLLSLLRRHPVMWQGVLALKAELAAVQMHFVHGNPNIARDSLPLLVDGSMPPLRIAQRMRLEQTQLEGVARKMEVSYSME